MSNLKIVKDITYFSFAGLSLLSVSFVVSILTGNAKMHPLWSADNSTVFSILLVVGVAAVVSVYRNIKQATSSAKS